MRRTVWSAGGCASWYLDSHGRNITLWPGSTFTFRRMTAPLRPASTTTRSTATRPAAEHARDPEEISA